ncbi:hypothetical protein D7X55_38915 [Corallococcus sp. AB049A]|uniref:Uncharacterized protein n=1 Tax=Corallococcus interemptor TaxID=2316720 RepID=A0A3A8PLI8_9BACT|nr:MULTISPECIES: hypothetical protein [Corallococcus]RKH37651.1 hypothetical protein D7Y23_39020 [Corallococcus sp. AB050B]RKH56959.1 hypothetical protein D7X96_38850 [Corallococcus interemptor]RKI43055.1 hypothetical protein D7X55_38915 [Corallococcus sp. AB049A]
MHQSRKQSAVPAETGPLSLGGRRKGARPVGMQEMGPNLYEKIESALTELSLVSSHERLSGT